MPTLLAAAGEPDRAWLEDLWRRRWAGTQMLVGGRVHHVGALGATIAWQDGEPKGAATYRLEGAQTELVSLDALRPRKGIGRALLEAVADRAADAGARRLVLFTTNGNLSALAFYQRVGLRLVDVRLGAVDAARRVKPAIPLIGEGGVEIHDEWRLERSLPRPEGQGRGCLRAGVVLVADGALALLEVADASATYALPCRHVEAREDPRAAVARLCLEELGLVVEAGPEVARTLVPGGVERYFAGRLGGGAPGRNVAWRPVDALPCLDVEPAAPAALLARRPNLTGMARR